MKQLYVALLGLAGIGAFTLVLIFVAPTIPTYLAQDEAGETQNTIKGMEKCSSLDAEITRIDGTIHVRNTGTIGLEEVKLNWRNSTGEYTEEIGSLQPNSVQMFSTPGIEEASVSVPGCEEKLGSYPETS